MNSTQDKTKYYGDDVELDRDVEAFIDREIQCCDSALIDKLIEKEVFEYADVQFLFDDETDDAKEILEWWRVSKWAAEKLEEQKEAVMVNDYGYWWGRTCSGQSIALDPTWYDIWHKIHA